MKAYLDAVKIAYGVVEPDCHFEKWLKLAYNQADRLDPTKKAPPSILDKPKPEPGDYKLW